MKKKDATRYANSLTFLRIFLTVLLYPLAYFQMRWMFVGVFVVACLTDAVDGWIARKYKATSEFGAKWDTQADQFLILSCAPFVYWFAPDVEFWWYQWPLLVGLWIFLNNVYCKIKFGRLANFHLYSAKVGTFCILTFSVWLIAFGFNEIIYWIATLSVAIAALEYSLILLFKKKLKTNMKSFFC